MTIAFVAQAQDLPVCARQKIWKPASNLGSRGPGPKGLYSFGDVCIALVNRLDARCSHEKL